MKMIDEKDMLVSMFRISSSTNTLANNLVNCLKCYDFVMMVIFSVQITLTLATTLNKIKIKERKEQLQERGTLDVSGEGRLLQW